MWNILFTAVEYSPHYNYPYLVNSAKTTGCFNGMECEMVKVKVESKSSFNRFTGRE
jgi:hypothetical protein